jgi:hypothetical protein
MVDPESVFLDAGAAYRDNKSKCNDGVIPCRRIGRCITLSSILWNGFQNNFLQHLQS